MRILNTIVPFLLAGLVSCSENNLTPVVEKLAKTTSVDCDSIYIRQDGLNTFYESNPTYFDIDPGPFGWSTISPASAGIDTAILNPGLNKLAFTPSQFSFLVVRNGKIAVERYYHGSGVDQSNNIHSASKSIICALIGTAIEDGLISGLNEPILDFFPAYNPANPIKHDITIEYLLSMSSGYLWVEDLSEYWVESRPNWMRAILSLPMVTDPGQYFNYSTGNTHLLSGILQEATGTSNCEYGHDRLFDPLGIETEHWGRDPQGYQSGGYNFYMTPREMARFGQLYLNVGWWNGQQLIPTQWIVQSLKTQMSVDADYDYGYCWWITKIDGYKVYKAWGYGGQYICLVPELNLQVVATADTHTTYYELDIDNFIGKYVLPAITP